MNEPGIPRAQRGLRTTVWRWILGSALALTAAAVLLVALILFPVPLFPHHKTVEGFSVYSDLEMPPTVEIVLRDAARRAVASPLARPGARYRVFLSYRPKPYAFICAASRRDPDAQALVFSYVGSMIISQQNVLRMRERTGGLPRHSRLEGSLAGAVAHEVAHLQLDAALGRRISHALPHWKSEGWADYAANLAPAREDPDYSLRSRARLLGDNDAWGPPRRPVDRRHFRWHVLVEYLASVRGMSLEEIVDDTVSEARAERALSAWLDGEGGLRPTGPPKTGGAAAPSGR